MKIIKARKKPVEIECIEYIDGDSRQDIIDWSKGECYYICFGQGSSFKCKTLEGELTISKGDYVVRGVSGEFYPVKPKEFSLTYNIVGERNEK